MAEHIEYQGNFSGSQIDTLLAKIQSSQVFTTEEKTKLASLVNYDDTEVKEDISDIETSLNSHKSDTTNPHEVTKAQVGLGNVDNTSDANKPISIAAQAALDSKANTEDINDINDTISALGVYEKKDFDDATAGTVSYYGQKIDVSKKFYIPLYYMSFKITSSNSVQGGAVYGDYYIQFTDKQSNFTVIDLKNRKVVQDTALTPVDTYHCNNVNFSDIFYDENDVFPLLYVSMENIAEHKVLVYRLVGNVGEITLQLIQTITFDAPESCNVYYPNACIDTDNGLLIQIGYTTNSYQKSDTNKIIFNTFNLPSLSNSNVSLPDNEKIDSFTLPSLHATQGSFVLDGKIYQVYGITDEKWIKVIDISTGKIVTSIDLNNQNTIIGEQETLFVWNNELYTVGINKCIYKLSTNIANFIPSKKVLIVPEAINGFSCAGDATKGALIYHRTSDTRSTIMIKKNGINPVFDLPVGNWTTMADYQYVDGTSIYYMNMYGILKIPEGATTIKLKMTNPNYYYGLVIARREKADTSKGNRIYDSGWKLGGTDIEYSLSGLDYTTYEYGVASTLKIGSAGTASFTNETTQSLGWSYEFIF